MPCTRYRLEKENEQKIFRHSEVADWYVIDTLRKTRKALGAGLELGKVRDAQLSPNGRYVAFIKDNNLYIHKLDFGTEVAVTKETDTDIISGVADWSLTGRNLFCLTGYTGLDPEINSTGLTPGFEGLYMYPRTRVFTLGASVQF